MRIIFSNNGNEILKLTTEIRKKNGKIFCLGDNYSSDNEKFQSNENIDYVISLGYYTILIKEQFLSNYNHIWIHDLDWFKENVDPGENDLVIISDFFSENMYFGYPKMIKIVNTYGLKTKHPGTILFSQSNFNLTKKEWKRLEQIILYTPESLIYENKNM